jgi:predicted nucleic acid-binding Zn ribbon protein
MWKYRFKTVPTWLSRLDLDFLNMSAKYPDIFSGLTNHNLYCASDYSGGTKDRNFYTASFLVVTDDSIERWNKSRQEIRKKLFHDNRRMSFKNLGDKIKRNALPSYLSAANELDGIICTFAFPRNLKDQFCSQEEATNIIKKGRNRAAWNKNSFRKMVTLASLQTFLIGGIVGNTKTIIWCTDDDDFTSTKKHSEDHAVWMSNFRSLHMPYHTGLAVFNSASKITPDCDNLFFEDLCSIPDLAAGAWSEAWSHVFAKEFPEPNMPFLTDWSACSDKSSEIMSWYCRKDSSLKKIHCIIGKPSSYKKEFSVLLVPSFDLPFG